MTTSNSDLDALTIQEFARRSSQSESTVRRRIKDGSLKAWQPGGPGTRLLIPVTCLPSAQVVTAPVSLPIQSISSPTSKAPQRLSGPTPRWKRFRKVT